MEEIKVGIIGPGNIGMDLMYKLERSKNMKLDTVVGIDSESEGLARAAKKGYNTTYKGLEDVIDKEEIKIYFDATLAKAHKNHAPILEKYGKIVIDLTPAAVGPLASPVVNTDQYLDEINVNIITCGGQATVPIVYAINKVADVVYAETISTVSSKSAGPGTRQSIDEFTRTTAKGVEIVGGADTGKSIIILNPAEPPIIMRNTIYTKVKNRDKEKIIKAVIDMENKIQSFVPGYKVTMKPEFDEDKVTTMVEVKGAGDYLPEYAGNLDIETASAVKLGELFADKLLKEGQNNG
ncbi:acetaldehyde dehydrogenase (acetylating) [Halanaerobium congolense]|jgi:acetaldehyde dehydrogenase|uniref:Acetaldehyde dehydrogenase n=1 Tax=Halanaerobium congolense TaxID=54121 RepID=A0A4R7DU07_9FIRM|nr:acetaldehyde dehydrogenase (acetylating) [Halanaerobium congolense]TDS25713.1 acetaldehyde dehydrogenase [Halanaerobium congolense]